MTTTVLSPSPKFFYWNSAGQPLVAGQLFTYIAGTTTPKSTYVDSTGIGANTNPVILDGMGSANVWLSPGLYKFVLQDQMGNVLWTVDNIGSAVAGYNLIATLEGPAGLRSLAPGSSLAVTTLGYNTVGDGGGGTYYWNAASTQADDGGVYIAPSPSVTGRWVLELNGYVSPFMYGAVGDGVNDDTGAVEAADAFVSGNNNFYLYINGIFYITQPALASDIVFSANGGLKWNTAIQPTVHASPSDDFQHFYVGSGGSAPVLYGIIEVKPEWFGAKGDGSFLNDTITTDDTAPIQLAINSCSTGMWVVFNSSKKYYCNAISIPTTHGGINLKGSQPFETDDENNPANEEYLANLQFIGSSGTFIQMADGVGGLRGPVLRDLIIDGSATAQTIIYLETFNAIIENCTIRNASPTGYCVCFDQSGSGNIVRNSVIYNAFLGIIATGAMTSGKVMGCSLYNCTGVAISIQNANNWMIDSNIIYDSMKDISVYGSNYSITNNQCVDPQETGIEINNTVIGNSIVTGNNISVTTGTNLIYGIYISSSVNNYVLVSNNSIYQGPSVVTQGWGIYSQNSGSVLPGNIENNQVVGYSGQAYHLADGYQTGQAFLDSTAYKTFKEIVGDYSAVDSSDQGKAQFIVHNPLDRADGLSTLVTACGSPSNAVNLWSRQFVTVNNINNLSRIHTSAGYDNTNVSPRTDTYTWDERDPVQGRFYWGNLGQEYGHLDANGLNIPAITVSGTAAVITPPVSYKVALNGTTVDTTSTLTYQTFLKMTTISFPQIDMTTQSSPTTVYLSSCNPLSAPDTIDSPQSPASFQVGAGLNSISLGQSIYAVALSDPTVTMTGTVTNYNFGTGVLTANLTGSTGAGTYTGWTVYQTSFPFVPAARGGRRGMLPFMIYGSSQDGVNPMPGAISMDSTQWQILTPFVRTYSGAESMVSSTWEETPLGSNYVYSIAPQSINLLIA